MVDSVIDDSIFEVAPSSNSGRTIMIISQNMTHTAPEMKKKAEELGVKIIWVPKGGTGRYQPLDRRTFGALKSKDKAK
jgi:hypothetical protein